MAENFFSPDYFTARNRFRKLAEKAGGTLETIRISAKGPNGEDLTIDIVWFGASEPRRVVVHSSGLHGVEGFAGSAIQLQLLSDVPVLPADTAVFVVHILNPYGMSWLRRVNEHNVDLNRNFREPGTYRGAPDDYAKANWFINPATPPSHDLYFAKLALLVMRYGMTALK
ncbi:MAG TPA: DUF2817 domain-containing protein, partial [Terriglobia bacterium]|nr:DUF2817 domain-containing protein [Terriglobia bacterium]